MVVAVVLKERRKEKTGGGDGAGGRRGSGGTGRWEAVVEIDHTIQASKPKACASAGDVLEYFDVGCARKRVTGVADGGRREEGGGRREEEGGGRREEEGGGRREEGGGWKVEGGGWVVVVNEVDGGGVGWMDWLRGVPGAR